MVAGLGTMPFGTGPLGGALADPPAGSSAAVYTARRIDPATKDFVMGSDGVLLGMGGVQQLVLLRVSVTQGTSAMRALGNRLRFIQRISDNFAREVDTTLRECVADLVQQKLITVVSITVQKKGSQGRFLMRWRDLTTTQEHDTPIG